MSVRILTIRELTAYLRSLLEDDPRLNNVWVRGEISNYKNHSSGHMYFTLKDESSAIRCVMFRTRNNRLLFAPANGLKVIVRGYISIFDRDGQYQLYTEEMQPDGLGALHLAFEQLKIELTHKGWFAPECKKKLPLIPKVIGVVTSKDGAAWRDIQTVIRRRFPGVTIVLAPASVQGEQAPGQIAAALNDLNNLALPQPDVIIVGRGGGSLEELWAFNTKEVARAIFNSGIPVVSAVGHETDTTIADLVADLRAATPSAAAELVVPRRETLIKQVAGNRGRLTEAAGFFLEQRRRRLAELQNRPVLSRPQRLLDQSRQALDYWHRLLRQTWREQQGVRLNRFQQAIAQLAALSPLATLQRGYSICLDQPAGQLIRSIHAIKTGDFVRIKLLDGALLAQVTAKESQRIENQEKNRVDL